MFLLSFACNSSCISKNLRPLSLILISCQVKWCLWKSVYSGVLFVQVQTMKSSRDSGYLEVETLRDELDQMRSWKDKVSVEACFVLWL